MLGRGDGRMAIARRQAIAIGLYLTVILFCAALLLVANFVDPAVRDSLLPIAADGFRTALAAFVGALSVLMGTNK